MQLPDAGQDGGGCEALMPLNGETCYDLPVHGASAADDASPFTVSVGETIDHFYYGVPWPDGTIGTGYGVVQSGSDVSVRAWAFSVAADAQAPGTVISNVTGSLLGGDARLIAAWSNGSCDVRLPASVGLELPNASGLLMVQWHHMNTTGAMQDDASAFRICTAPPTSGVQRVAFTWLGTENLGGPIGMAPGMNQFRGSCANDSGGDITIVGLDPQMRALGIEAASVVQRAGGQVETVFDRPFRFGAGRDLLLSAPVVLHPGDAIESTCTYDNTTSGYVGFGMSIRQELCYLFALAYPPLALDNGVASLFGATNTCW
jgi:hypothetical protein